MKRNVKVTCDSTCDLPQKMYQERMISVIPMTVTLGEETRRDGVDVTNEELFHYVEASGNLPKTSAISIYEFTEFFEKLVKEGSRVIHVSLSSELSSSYQNACIAAREVGNVYVVDGRSLSTGSAHLVLLAQEMAQAGMEAAEIVEQLDQVRERLDVSFVLQTLEYLHKGGRCSGIVALGANLMKLHPEIVVSDGKMDVGRKYRGSMEKSILAYVRGRLEGRNDVDCKRIFVTHSGVPGEIVEKVVALIKELQPFEEIIEATAGSTIASHCGPGCLGVLFLKKEA